MLLVLQNGNILQKTQDLCMRLLKKNMDMLNCVYRWLGDAEIYGCINVQG